MKGTEILMSDDLTLIIKPCPFCGENSISYEEGTSFKYVLMRCNDCGAQGGEVRIETMIPRKEALMLGQNRAINAWNERTVKDGN